MPKLTNFPADFGKNRLAYFADDNFAGYLAQAERFATVGTVAQSVGANAPLTVTTGANDNDGALLREVPSPWRLSDTKAVEMNALVTFDEATVNGQTGLFIGLTDKTAIDDILPDNGGNPVSGTYVGLLAQDGSQNIKCVVAINGAPKIVEIDGLTLDSFIRSAVLASATTDRWFSIMVRPHSPGRIEVNFKVDDHDLASIAVDPTGAANLRRCVAVKTGSANAQAAVVHYWSAQQVR